MQSAQLAIFKNEDFFQAQCVYLEGRDGYKLAYFLRDGGNHHAP